MDYWFVGSGFLELKILSFHLFFGEEWGGVIGAQSGFPYIDMYICIYRYPVVQVVLTCHDIWSFWVSTWRRFCSFLFEVHQVFVEGQC